MVDQDLRTARDLYHEHTRAYFYPARKKAGYIRRCRNVFSKLDIENQNNWTLNQRYTLMYLDNIALKLNFTLEAI